MIRLILVVIVLILALISGAAVALHHFFGWKGLIAFPFLLLALVWVAKFVIGKLIKRFAVGLFGMKAAALRGATMNIHSITPVEKPVRKESDAEESEESEEGSEGSEDEDEDDDENEPEEAEKPQHYFAVDLTITPKVEGDASSAVWEPGELVLASGKINGLEDLHEKEIGRAYDIAVWNGTTFGPDSDGKYPGAQRLRIVFEVEQGKTQAWLHYYNESLGEIILPEWRRSLAPA